MKGNPVALRRIFPVFSTSCTSRCGKVGTAEAAEGFRVAPSQLHEQRACFGCLQRFQVLTAVIPRTNLTAEATEHDESMSHMCVNDRQSLTIATGFLDHLAASCSQVQLPSGPRVLQNGSQAEKHHVQTLSAQHLRSRSMMPLSAPPDARRSPGPTGMGQ